MARVILCLLAAVLTGCTVPSNTVPGTAPSVAQPTTLVTGTPAVGASPLEAVTATPVAESPAPSATAAPRLNP